jgi:general L-amino acid transport system substrate-binding protein
LKPIEAREFSLPADWQARVVTAAGTYADIFARNLGERSPLELPRAPNAPVEACGRFATPFRE